MAVMSDGGAGGDSGVESASESRVKSGSIRVEPRKMVFVRREKNRVICPRWKASQALELPKP